MVGRFLCSCCSPFMSRIRLAWHVGLQLNLALERCTDCEGTSWKAIHLVALLGGWVHAFWLAFCYEGFWYLTLDVGNRLPSMRHICCRTLHEFVSIFWVVIQNCCVFMCCADCKIEFF